MLTYHQLFLANRQLFLTLRRHTLFFINFFLLTVNFFLLYADAYFLYISHVSTCHHLSLFKTSHDDDVVGPPREAVALMAMSNRGKSHWRQRCWQEEVRLGVAFKDFIFSCTFPKKDICHKDFLTGRKQHPGGRSRRNTLANGPSSTSWT